MKKLSLFLVPSLALALTACQSDDALNPANNDSAQNATITVSIPDAITTRAADTQADASDALFGPTSNSAMGGLTNLMNPKETATNVYNKYDLRYKLAVYEATTMTEKDTTWTLVIPANADNNTLRTLSTWEGGADVNKQTFSLQLLPTHTYKVVCWADFVSKGKTEDLHYATDCLSDANASSKVITCKDNREVQLNDESRDAYYIQKTFKDVSEGLNENLVLRRPFAKIRFVTTDWQTMDNAKDEWPDTYKLTYKNCKRFYDLDPVTAESKSYDKGETDQYVYEGNKISLDGREYALNYDMHKKNRTLVVDYLMTDKTDETEIHMNFEAINSTSGKTIMSRDFTTDIPIKRNWLTTILGNLLTVNGNFTVSINENFYGEWVDAYPWFDPTEITPTKPIVHADGTYHVYTREQFAWLTNEDSAKVAFKAGVYLENDIDMNNAGDKDNNGNIDWQPIYYYSANKEPGTFDGQGHVLRNFNITHYVGNSKGSTVDIDHTSWGVFGVFVGNIKNVTFENITINGLAESNNHTSQLGSAGPIGILVGDLINVHSKHIFIKGQEKTKFAYPGGAKETGGIVGTVFCALPQFTGKKYEISSWDNMCNIKDCTAEDIHLKGVWAGGLAGFVGCGYKVDNCSTDYVYILSPKESSRFIGCLGNNVWLTTSNKTTDNVWFDGVKVTNLTSDKLEKYPSASVRLWSGLAKYPVPSGELGQSLYAHGNWGGMTMKITNGVPTNTYIKTAVYTGDSSTDNIIYGDSAN